MMFLEQTPGPGRDTRTDTGPTPEVVGVAKYFARESGPLVAGVNFLASAVADPTRVALHWQRLGSENGAVLLAFLADMLADRVQGFVSAVQATDRDGAA